jgi:hydroxyacylglutathione hydrolase
VSLSRPTVLSDSARWWPSTLFQTTTLELRRDGVGVLIDPGISPWEIQEAAGEGVAEVVITHGDWDHVLGIGLLEGARVTAGRLTAYRLAAAGARDAVEDAAAEYYVECRGLERLRVDRPVDPPAEIELGPWTAVFRPAPGHTEDGIAISLPDEGLLVVGDYLSELEIPFVNATLGDYERTLELVVEVIETEQPAHVVVGHGRPHASARALEIAHEDLAYLAALRSFAENGGTLERADDVVCPRRDPTGDPAAHRRNVAQLLATLD